MSIAMTLCFPLRWEEAIGEFGADEGSDPNLSFIRNTLVLVLRIGYGAWKEGVHFCKAIVIVQAIDGNWVH